MLVLGGFSQKCSKVNQPWLDYFILTLFFFLQAEPNDVDITIRVLDDNDNAPVFDKESLIGEVSESAVAGMSKCYCLLGLLSVQCFRNRGKFSTF